MAKQSIGVSAFATKTAAFDEIKRIKNDTVGLHGSFLMAVDRMVKAECLRAKTLLRRGGNMFSSRLLKVVVLAVAALNSSVNTVSSEQAERSAARKSADVAVITEKSAAECSARLQGFIEELEGLLSREHSVYPIQRLFEKYFPLEGCDPGAVLGLCLKSKYCRDASAHPDIMVIAFDNRPNDPHWGLYVQFGLNRRTGDSQLPFVKVKI